MAIGKGEVHLEIEGTRYTLVFDFEAMAAFEDATDLSVLEVPDMMASGRPPKLSVLGALLQAGLSRHHPDITRAEAMQLFMRPGAQDALNKAFELSMPPVDDRAETGAETGAGEVPAKKQGKRPSKGRRAA